MKSPSRAMTAGWRSSTDSDIGETAFLCCCRCSPGSGRLGPGGSLPLNAAGDGASQTGPAFTQAPFWHFTSLSGSLVPGCHHETLLAFPQGIFMGLSAAVSRLPGWSRSVFRASSFLTLSLAQGYSARCLAPLFVLFFTGGLCMPGSWPHLSLGRHRQGEERRPRAGASLLRGASLLSLSMPFDRARCALAGALRIERCGSYSLACGAVPFRAFAMVS